jgi:hypothetical protein
MEMNLTSRIQPPDHTEWITLKPAWDAAYAITSTGNAKPSETLAKNEARSAYESFLRKMVKVLFNPATDIVTDPIRVELGLPIYTGERKKREIGDAAPVIEGKIEGRSQKISFFRADDVNKRGVIPAADGVEFYWKKGGELTVDISQYTFVVAIRRSPYIHTFEPTDEGLKIHWVARWYNSKGEKGPWSNFITVVVGNE